MSPGTVLDGLSTGLTGMVARLAAVAPDGERHFQLLSAEGRDSLDSGLTAEPMDESIRV